MRKTAAVVVLGLTLTGCGAAATSASSAITSSTAPSPTVTATLLPVSAKGSTGQVVLTLAQPAGTVRTKTSFAVAGTSNSVEANTPWSLANATTHKTVRTGFFTADGWGTKLYPYRGTVSVKGLPAGTYVFTVRVDDPSDGEGNAVPQLSRTVVVG